ncbi:hypothetical protein YC2023_010359 [Brassica napus]
MLILMKFCNTQHQANGKSSVPTDHPPNYADIAKKERPRIQELIQSKGSQYFFCPQFNVSVRGQKVSAVISDHSNYPKE